MATQGLITIVNTEGKVLVKCIAGCNGMTANKVANVLKVSKHLSDGIKGIYNICIDNDFGCEDCLIIQSHDSFIFKGGDVLLERFHNTFNSPEFNPRWDKGTADYTEIVIVKEGKL